jgi:hypothetical protein
MVRNASRERRAIWKIRFPSRFLFCIAGCLPGFVLLWAVVRNGSDWSVIADLQRYCLLLIADLIICLAIPLAVRIMSTRTKSSGEQTENRQDATLVVLCVVALLPPSLAMLATLGQLAALAEYRFTISSSTLLVVLAGVVTGRLATRGQRISVALSVLILAIVTNPVLPMLLKSGALPAQRHEYWEQAITIINSDQLPVSIYPNLVEDRRFAETELSDERQAYYRFAVSGIYSVAGTGNATRQVVARSLSGPQLLSPFQREEFERQGGGWLLIRSRRADALPVVNGILRQFGSGWKMGIEDRSLPPLLLFRLTIVPAAPPN